MILIVTLERVVVRRSQAPQSLFHYENLRPTSMLLEANEEIQIAPGTTLKLNRAAFREGSMGFNLTQEDQPSHPFHAEVSITHPASFSLYGKEGDYDDFVQITDGMEILDDQVTIPALHMKSDYGDYSKYQLVVFDNHRQSVVATVHFKEVSRDDRWANFFIYSPPKFKVTVPKS